MINDIFSAPNQMPGQATIASGNGAERKSPICLVIEDDSTMRHLVTNYLKDHDIRAVSASRRDEVLTLLTRSRPDLVILDLRLGREDGLDLLRERAAPASRTAW
jgi:DNA-binding response OmpR family regulator